MELFAKRMTWELDNEEGLSCLSFELEDGYFTPVSYTHLTLPTIYSV